ncbi:hypothetical protein G7Y89_g13353 [Cudoniella acicularis]|uniref:Mediator of RNA polymerase II transcription subunit 12 n=1 Tax=Cudoniella acicularis TaxID=354080 RepID=A0A8H4R724_9HELO|nr:hypothetical protein G7Y89_g13353 [Cudoniella acicularis]
MTTRPTLGHRQPPQRSLSTTNVVQRPPPHRTLSQQFPSTSPARRGNETFVDLTFEGSEAVPGRYGTIPRMGSQLRLEILDSSNAELVQSPKPAAEATPTYRTPIPPRGRPQLHFDVPSVSTLSPRAAQDGVQNEVAIKPMPLPMRPGQHAPPSSGKSRVAMTSSAKKDARPKPYTLEVPTIAPRYPPNGHVDFFPWTGNHPEDQFSEPVIRQGYFDKAQMTQNETGSARASIFPALKHKSGLQTLSSLFTTVLAQRRSHGQITSSSTFKPPPRVTVTDTKREMWLKDLANPTIPLRRLKGKELVERLQWEARRSGFETLLIRLAAHFHAEHLLDREHYMDWLVSSLENSPQTKLPLWILITQIYWKDLVLYRKYGRKLSGALLNHFSEILKHPDQDILAPLSDRLHSLLKALMASNPDGFISPKIWAKNRDIVRLNLVSDDERFLVIFEAIDRRNSHISVRGTDKEPTTRQRLIQLLDGSFSTLPTDDLLRQCWQIDDDKTAILQGILEWSTSLYRPGVSKTYLAARIFRFWSRFGVDTTEAILRFLDSEVCDVGRNKPSFYHLVSELARSEHFSTPRYVQWLIARGGLVGQKDTALDGPCATRLLAELPTFSLSEGIISLQKELLSRAEFSMDEEEGKMRDCMTSINRMLPAMQANADLGLECDNLRVTDDIPDLVSQICRSSKTEIGLWLRHKVRVQMQQPTIPPLDDWDTTPMKAGTSAITASDFHFVRLYLELIEDYSMLADVLKITTSSNDPEVLASCADTLNLHLDTFAAIGALHSLFEILLARLRALADDQDSIPRIFLVSLLDLATRIPEQKTLAQQLSQELAMSDRKNAADACSPVSDHIAITQTSEDFTEEIEKILASGNSMDQATLDRLFQRVVIQVESSSGKHPEQQRDLGLLLTKLHPFDAQHFDVLMSAWVGRFLRMSNRPSMIRVFGPLISFGCLSLSVLVASCESLFEKEALTNRSSNSGIPNELLTLLVGVSDPSGIMAIEEAYRFRLKQTHMQKDFPLEVLTSIRQALAQSLGPSEDTLYPRTFDTTTLLDSRGSWELLQKYSLLQPDLVVHALVMPLLQKPSSQGAISILAIVNKLLRQNSDDHITTETILDIADDLTLPFCQIKLESMFSGEDSVMSGTDDSRSEHLQAFDNAIEAAVNSGKTAWASIVPLLDVSVAQHLRRRAELQFLSLFPSHKIGNTYDFSEMDGRIVHAKNLLHIINSTTYSISATLPAGSNQTSLAQDILTTLNGIRLLLSNTQIIQIKDALISNWIPLILSFITLHTSEFEATRSGHECRAKAILALSAILLEIRALDLNTEAVNELIEQTFDLALHLIDSLPDDVRQQCIRSLRDTVSNPQMSYLFSHATNPSDWLVLSQKENVPNIPNPGGGLDGTDRRVVEKEKLTPFVLRRWELLGEPTPNIGENDTSLNLTLFGARRGYTARYWISPGRPSTPTPATRHIVGLTRNNITWSTLATGTSKYHIFPVHRGMAWHDMGELDCCNTPLQLPRADFESSLRLLNRIAT